MKKDLKYEKKAGRNAVRYFRNIGLSIALAASVVLTQSTYAVNILAASIEDCDLDGYDDYTGNPVPWVGFDSTKGQEIPSDWDGKTIYKSKKDYEEAHQKAEEPKKEESSSSSSSNNSSSSNSSSSGSDSKSSTSAKSSSSSGTTSGSSSSKSSSSSSKKSTSSKSSKSSSSSSSKKSTTSESSTSKSNTTESSKAETVSDSVDNNQAEEEEILQPTVGDTVNNTKDAQPTEAPATVQTQEERMEVAQAATQQQAGTAVSQEEDTTVDEADEAEEAEDEPEVADTFLEALTVGFTPENKNLAPGLAILGALAAEGIITVLFTSLFGKK